MGMHPIRFDDGDAYERLMGIWSGMVGQVFLDWLSPASGQRWADIGCGTGAFTELILRRCAPAKVHGIDPSDGQLAYARTRPALMVFYTLAVVLIGVALALAGAGWMAWIGLAAFAVHLVSQIETLEIDDPKLCLRIFKSNRDAGLLLFAGLLVDAAMRAG